MMQPSSPIALSPASFAYLRQWAWRACGVVLTADTEAHLQTRLRTVLDEHRLASVDDLCRALARGSAALRRSTVQAVTVHETSFFRDPAAFAAMRHELLPRLLAQRPAQARLRIWSAATSSGQEAYSVAMMLADAGIAPDRIDVLGTDICEATLARAQQATYGAFETSRGVPPTMLSRFFEPCIDHRHLRSFRVCDTVRSTVRFLPTDLRALPAEFGPFDLILCRNAMIYFDQPTRHIVFRELHRALAPDGFLLLGTAEVAPAIFHPAGLSSTLAYIPAR